jgi:hypothetical protein
MNLLIKAIFYTKGGSVIQDGIEYGKSNEEVTDASFREEVEGIATQIKEQIGEGIITEGGKVYSFGNTVIRFSEIVGYQIFIEEIVSNPYNGIDLPKIENDSEDFENYFDPNILKENEIGEEENEVF